MGLLSLEDLSPLIMTEVGVAPLSVVNQKAREVARDFCQRTRAWQWDAPTQTITANKATYDMGSLGDAEPVSIEYMSVDGGTVLPKDTDWLNTNRRNWRTAPGDDVSVYTQESRKSFRFAFVPTQNGTTDGLFYRLSLKPGPNGLDIDEDVMSDWSEAIATGTKGKLMLMIGNAWGNPQLGAFYWQDYLVERSKARIRVQKSRTDVQQVWVGPHPRSQRAF